MSSLGKIKLVRTVEGIPSPSTRAKTIEAKDCAGMGITNAGVLVDLKDKRRLLIPWPNVLLVELEPESAKGKSREG